MCGLLALVGHAAGVINGETVEAVAGASQLMRHRGPDEPGTWADDQVVLGFNRLSIIDIAHSHQPLRWGPPGEPDRYVLVERIVPAIAAGRDDTLPVLYRLDNDQLSALCRNATAYLLEKEPGHGFNGAGASEMSKFAAKVIGITKRQASDYFSLNKEFLAPYTKAGIEAILREAVNGNGVAFVEWYESQAEKKVSGLMQQKKEDILNEVFADGGFDFNGYVPTCISKFIGDNNN